MTTPRVRYAIAACDLGWLLVAATPDGLCAVELGDSADALEAGLRRRFAAATRAAEDPPFAQQVAAVLRAVGSPAAAINIPLDAGGTPFQQRVWRALRAVPAGSTVSYADIARRIGRPTAARAVAQACAANRIAIVIPCHRVLRSDGALSGYRWGVARKRALLEREAGARR